MGTESQQTQLRQILLSVDGQIEPHRAAPTAVTSEHDLVFVASPFDEATLHHLSSLDATPWLVILTPRLDGALMSRIEGVSNLVALLSIDAKGGPRVGHMMYVIRRLLSPMAVTPSSQELMRWGSTTISWTPRSTAEAASLVDALGAVGHRLGLSQAEAAATCVAAHELVTNALYAAPTDSKGNLRFAHHREQPVELSASEAPRIELTVDGNSVAVDVTDPFGGLTAARFFAAIGNDLAGSGGVVTLDRSHGSAGLGLSRCLREGATLRAEVTPGVRSFVGWWRDRRHHLPSAGRSAIFLETSS